MIENRFENRLNKSDIKFNTLNPVWDNEKETALNVFEMIDLLNELNDKNKFLSEFRGFITMEHQKLKEENEQLKQQNSELKLDNDIKFWKLQCIKFANSNGIIMHEISRAIEEGYEVSNEFKQYINDLKVQNEKNRGKAKRLGI